MAWVMWRGGQRNNSTWTKNVALLASPPLPSPSGPTTFVELLPMVSSPSLYGRGQFSIASSSTQLRPLLTTKYEKNCASQCSVGHSCAQRYDSCEGRGGEIICMIGSPRPPMYSPPSTWGAPLLQMSLPPNKTMGEKSGFTLGSLVTAGRTGFMQELNSRGIVRQHSQPMQHQTEFEIKRYMKEGCEVCVCSVWQRGGQWYPCIRRYHIALCRLPSHLGVTLDQIGQI